MPVLAKSSLCCHNRDLCVAEMAELVDARDSKSRAARRAGSIPALGTKECKPLEKSRGFFRFSNLQIRQTLGAFMCVKNFFQHTDHSTQFVI